MWWTGIPYFADVPGSDFSASMPPRSSHVRAGASVWLATVKHQSEVSLMPCGGDRFAINRSRSIASGDRWPWFGLEASTCLAGSSKTAKPFTSPNGTMDGSSRASAAEPPQRPNEKHHETWGKGERRSGDDQQGNGHNVPNIHGMRVDRAPPAPCSIRHADVGWLVKSYTASLVYSHSATPPW